LDLGEFEIPKEHIINLVTMQGGHGQPLPDGIELNFQNSGGAPKPQALGQQAEAHKDCFLWTAKIEKRRARTAGKGLTTGAT